MPNQPRHPKTPETRQAEVRQLTQQLEEVGLPEEVLRPVHAALADFAASGQGYTHTVKVPGTPIVLHCLLSNQAHVVSHIRITRRP